MTSMCESKLTLKKIILHAGLHKTGTTTIQNVLFQNRSILKKRNILYPEFSINNRVFTNHSVPLLIQFASNPEKIHHVIIRGLGSRHKVLKQKAVHLADLKRQIAESKPDTLLISAEGLSSQKFKIQDLKAMKAYFEEHYGNVQFQVILTLRNPVKFFPSIIQQQLKGLQTLHSSHERWLALSDGFFKKIVENFIDVFGYEHITLVKFEDLIKHPKGMACAILEALGYEDIKLSRKRTVHKNSSMSLEACALMSSINATVPKIIVNKFNPDRKGFKSTKIIHIPGEKFVLNAKLLQKIVEPTKDDLDWCCETFNLEPYSNLDIPDEHPKKVWASRTFIPLLFHYLSFPPKIRKSITHTLKSESRAPEQQIYQSQKLKWATIFGVIGFLDLSARCTDLFLWYYSPLRKVYRALVKA